MYHLKTNHSNRSLKPPRREIQPQMEKGNQSIVMLLNFAIDLHTIYVIVWAHICPKERKTVILVNKAVLPVHKVLNRFISPPIFHLSSFIESPTCIAMQKSAVKLIEYLQL